MVHTGPDYSEEYKQSKVYGLIDNAEHSARQGINSFFDRRGNLVWYDDFEAAAASKWVTAADGAGTVALSTDRAWMGNQSLKTVTGAAALDGCYWGKFFSLPFERRMGVEFMFTLTGGKPFITINITGYDGTNFHRGGIRFNYNTLALEYQTGLLAWTALTLKDTISLTNEQWIPLKFVVDWDLGEYVRLLFGGTEYDMSGLTMFTQANAARKQISISGMTQSATAAAATAYIDNFIFTQNE